MADLPPWIETPCLYSEALSKTAGCNIYLKLECLQPSGSFKSRGIGHLMVRAVARARSERGSDVDVRFYCSSGGNAGLACATAARQLGYTATIVVPESTSAYMVARLRAASGDANVQQHGANWAAADAYLRTVMPNADADADADADATTNDGVYAVYVPPFDHADIWDGAATLVDEVMRQVPVVPDAFVCSVGGGGLLCGLMAGLADNVKTDKTKVVAVETRGADSLMASVQAKSLVTLPGITSIATSLGSVRVAARAWEWVQQRPESVVPVVVDDADAVHAMVRFLDDTRLLVEPACGAALAPVYVTSTSPRTDGRATTVLQQALAPELAADAWARQTVVVVVCGGSNISPDMLAAYRTQFAT